MLIAEKVLRLKLIFFPNSLEQFFQVIIKEEAVGISTFWGTLPSTPYGSFICSIPKTPAWLNLPFLFDLTTTLSLSVFPYGQELKEC